MANSEKLFELPDLNDEERSRLRYATQAIIERARACESETARVKLLHDWLVRRCVYGETPGNEDEAYTAYGALMTGKAVCAGIAQAFGYLCRQTSIECRFVAGYSGRNAKPSKNEGDGDHAWNLVRVDGVWYHIDVTHDLNHSAKLMRYDYFLLSDAEAATSRTWHIPSYPRCPTSFGYYRRAGLFAPDAASLNALLQRRVTGSTPFVFQMPVFAESDDDAIDGYLKKAIRASLAETGTRWKSLTLGSNHKRGVYQVTLKLAA